MLISPTAIIVERIVEDESRRFPLYGKGLFNRNRLCCRLGLLEFIIFSDRCPQLSAIILFLLDVSFHRSDHDHCGLVWSISYKLRIFLGEQPANLLIILFSV